MMDQPSGQPDDDDGDVRPLRSRRELKHRGLHVVVDIAKDVGEYVEFKEI